jgi:hypothetical protein
MNKYIARTVQIYANGNLLIRLHIDSLTSADDFAILDEPIPQEAQKISFHRKDQPYYVGPMRGQVLKGTDALLSHLGHGGTVVVKAHVDTTGAVVSTEIISSPSQFATNGALSSVRNWRYRAGYDKDHLAEFDDFISFNFGELK